VQYRDLLSRFDLSLQLYVVSLNGLRFGHGIAHRLACLLVAKRQEHNNGVCDLLANQYASLPKSLVDLIVVYLEPGKQDLVLFFCDRPPKGSVSLCCGLAALLNKRPKGSIIKVVNVSVCLPPRKIVAYLLLSWIEDYPPIKGRWVLQGVIW